MLVENNIARLMIGVLFGRRRDERGENLRSTNTSSRWLEVCFGTAICAST